MSKDTKALAVRRESTLARPEPSLDRTAFEPRTWQDAEAMASALAKSDMLPPVKRHGQSPRPMSREGALAILVQGRELGLTWMQSLRSIYVVDGKPALSAQLMIALILRSGLASYFRRVESTDERAVWETLRKGTPEPVRGEFTIKDAQRAGLLSNPVWTKWPRTMLRWRAAADLAREVYPDVIAGLYTPEELGADEAVTIEARAEREPESRETEEIIDAEIVPPEEPRKDPKIQALKKELLELLGAEQAKAVFETQIKPGPAEGLEARLRAAIDEARAQAAEEPETEVCGACNGSAAVPCTSCTNGRKTCWCRTDPMAGLRYDGACPDCKNVGWTKCLICEGRATIPCGECQPREEEANGKDE